MELEVQKLINETIVRPKGTLGTCGWSPKAWQATYVGKNETPEQAFLKANPNWRK